MPAILERCVKKLRRKKGVKSAWAICTASLQQAGKLKRKKK